MTRPMMEEERSHMTERILNLTLEIIYLLTGESFPPLKSGDHVTITVPPCDSLKPGRPDMEKIVEATKKMMELLTGESGIVNNFKIHVKEEKEDDERSMMEASSSPCPLHSRDHNDQSEKLEDGHLVVKEENIEEDEEYGGAKEPSEGHREDLTIPHHDQGEDLTDIKVEVKSEDDETYVREDQRSTEEAAMMRTSIEEAGGLFVVRGRDVGKISEDGLMLSPEDEDVTQYSSGEDHDVHQMPQGAEGASYASNPGVPQTGRDGDIVPTTGVPPHSHKCQDSFTCPDCGECFVKMSDLQRYQNSALTAKPYSCSECGKSFSLKGTLTIHQRTHTGERPYPCPECGERFFRKYHLTTHQRTHTGEKPYSCSECGKRFASKSSLSVHQRNHTGDKPYSCTECDKCFAHKSQLVIHHRSHTGERPYSCEECGKSFARLGHFHAHQRSHRRWETISAQEREMFYTEVSSYQESEVPHNT